MSCLCLYRCYKNCPYIICGAIYSSDPLALPRQVEKADSNELGVMGDEVARKVDSVSFTQERLKRQIDNLDDRVKVRSSHAGSVVRGG